MFIGAEDAVCSGTLLPWQCSRTGCPAWHCSVPSPAGGWCSLQGLWENFLSAAALPGQGVPCASYSSATPSLPLREEDYMMEWNKTLV